MSNLQDLDAQLAEKERQQRVYDTAMRRLDRQRLRQEGEGLGIVYAWNAFGEKSLGDSRLGRLSSLAEKVCIGFAFLTPAGVRSAGGREMQGIWRVALAPSRTEYPGAITLPAGSDGAPHRRGA